MCVNLECDEKKLFHILTPGNSPGHRLKTRFFLLIPLSSSPSENLNMDHGCRIHCVPLFAAVLIAFMGACTHDPVEPDFAEDRTIHLRWVKAYPDEQRNQVETGLKWTLSFLGAQLPQGSFEQATEWEGDLLTLHLDRVGFDHNALQALQELAEVLRKSEEYTSTGGIDIGRFVMLTLNASNHYYAITGIPPSLEAFMSDKTFDPVKAGIAESSVSFHERAISVPDTQAGGISWAFVAREGEGSLADGSFEEKEIEVLDVMPNGQFRFAIYSPAGDLLTHGDPLLGQAGKPAKCLWCHEITLQPAYNLQVSVGGYHGPAVFTAFVKNRMNTLLDYRSTLKGDIDFSKNQEHTQTELLYISFTEPSAMRLAAEWNTTEAEVQQLLKDLPTHTHPEFPFLGELYHRSDTEPYAPYQAIATPGSPREASDYEPNLIP